VAQARLERIPLAFIRDKVKKGLEAYAQRQRITLITPDVMKAGMAGMERPSAFKKLPAFWQQDESENSRKET
jgi:hypothetical protein